MRPYDPYGDDEKVAPDGAADPNAPDAALSDTAKDNPFRYESFYFDSGVKSYDMQAREYRPDSGRFLSADRYESAAADQVLQADPLTQNRYAFAGGNPVNNVEFDGHYTAGPTGTGAPWRHRHPARSGGGPSGNGSLDTSYVGPTAPRVTAATTRRVNARALNLSKTHPMAALNAGLSHYGTFGSSPAAAGLKSALSSAGDGFNYLGDRVDDWNTYNGAPTVYSPPPGTRVANSSIASQMLHASGADLKSGDPVRVLTVLVGFTPVGRLAGTAAKVLAPKAFEALRGAFAGRAAEEGTAVLPKPGSRGGPGTGNRHIPIAIKREEIDASQGLCRFCQNPLEPRSGSPLSREFDHAIPYSRDGGTTFENIQALCRTCNRRKRDLTTGEYLERLLQQPPE